MAFTNTPNDGHEHEWNDAEILHAGWVIPPDPNGLKNNLPKVFKEGSATMAHTCHKCGATETWTV